MRKPIRCLKKQMHLIIATEWNEFRTPDFDKNVSNYERAKVIFDGRNLFDMAAIERDGFLL